MGFIPWWVESAPRILVDPTTTLNERGRCFCGVEFVTRRWQVEDESGEQGPMVITVTRQGIGLAR
jgi:hypothetical protein